MGQTSNGKVSLDQLRPHLAVKTIDDGTIIKADQGDPEAQTDVAVMLMEHDQYELAAAWLKRAAEKSPEAMSWLSQCYLRGTGLEQNLDLGFMWLHRAAAAGHVISKGQTEALLAAAANGLTK